MRITEVLKERGLSRYRLARDIGIALPDIYAALNGTKPLYPGYRRKIAQYLDLPEDEVFPEFLEVRNDDNA